MAAKREDPRRAKSKMTFIMFQLDGGDETLQQSFRTIGQALGNAFQHANQLPARQLPPTLGGVSEPDPEIEIIEDGEQEAPVDTNGQAGTPPRRPRSAPKSPELLATLNLNQGTPPLKEFLGTHNPGEVESRRYLAITHWFKNHFDTPEVTVNHIHTAYRHMGWHTPKDAAGPLRDLKNKNQWLTKGSAPGTFAINHIGENQVNAMASATQPKPSGGT